MMIFPIQMNMALSGNQLLNDNVKVLVATTALAMGYDKPNLGFVVHFGCGSIVTIIRVGRAGEP